MEVQIGLQSGDAHTFVLGQIIFVRPRGPNDFFGWLGGPKSHNELAIGAQREQNLDTKEGSDYQIFVSWTRADMAKNDIFSVDFQDVLYVKIPAVSSGSGAVGNQVGVTGNVDLNGVLEWLLKVKTDVLPTGFLSSATSSRVGPAGKSLLRPVRVEEGLLASLSWPTSTGDILPRHESCSLMPCGHRGHSGVY